MKRSTLIHKHKAFVLSLFDTGLGVVRSLGRAGVAVVGFDSNPVMPGFASRYCAARLSPDPVSQPEALLEVLLKESESLAEPAVLMPASDAYALFIARYRAELSRRFLFLLPADDTLDALVEKRSQYELAARIGMPLAQTCYPDTMDDVARIKDELEYPVFIKPYYGHLWREIYGSAHKGFEVSSPGELARRFAEIFGHGLQALAQSIILGPDSNLYEASFYIDREGRPKAIFTHRKIHQYPPHYGVASCAESVVYPELVALGLKLMAGFQYRGISSIEFKRDDRDGQLKLIELNPRFGQQNLLAAYCGVNFPLIEYLDLTGQPQESVRDFKVGVKWLDPVLDVPSFLQYARRGETTLWEWLKSWKGVRTFPVFAWDDLGPFWKKYENGKKFLALPRVLLRGA